MNSITEQLLGVVSDWDGSYKGAFNIREDGGCAGRQSSENIKIEPKNELDNQNDLISELKEFRKEISKEMKIPPFYVFNDEELSKIVSQRPKNIEDLKSVLTPIKIKIHGENIIKIVNKTSSIN